MKKTMKNRKRVLVIFKELDRNTQICFNTQCYQYAVPQDTNYFDFMDRQCAKAREGEQWWKNQGYDVDVMCQTFGL